MSRPAPPVLSINAAGWTSPGNQVRDVMSMALRVALIYPPVTDPTAGYHSLNYIDSYARSRGFPAADLFDANIEAFHHTFSPDGVAWLEGCRATAPDLPAGAPMPGNMLRARRLMDDVGDPEAVREAVRVLRDPELFYQYPRYVQAVDDVIAWMNHVGAAGFPGQFSGGFQLVPTPGVMAGSVNELTDPAVLARYSRPFQAYYEDVLIPRLRAGGYDVVGLSIAYSAQLPFALHLMSLIRSAMPGVFLIAGGTEVSDVWKYAQDKAMFFQIFADCDATVVGEGETAYTAILEAVAAGTLPTGHPNVRLHPRYGPARLLPARYEPLADLPTPDFSNLPWHLYLSPEPFVYYAPTRGCYWNKCTFCDYGLNGDSPTSPWRQDTVDTMIRDVTAIAKQARFIYFSVDVLAPATILRFAEEAAARKLDIRWGAEIRLENYWSDERCELLRRSGCVAVSVGFESGNQRILDLIDKGTRPARIKQTITAMSRAGIAVQMMGFTGFPTETADEAMDSIRFLLDNRGQWTFGGLGDFTLTSGAIVARQPERFGISNVRPIPGSGIARTLDYDEPVSQHAKAQVATAKAGLGATRHPRPWLGGVDTAHSFFYHDRHGPEIVSDLRSALLGDDAQLDSFVINGSFSETPDPATIAAYATMYGGQLRTGEGVDTCFRRADGAIFLLPEPVRSFLELFAEPRTLAQVNAEVLLSEPTVRKLWAAALCNGLIRRVLPREA
jgi:anaerobic magnesium-protoporphyrin IX monomethyl ester cyclase